jgi:hypothetical protein
VCLVVARAAQKRGGGRPRGYPGAAPHGGSRAIPCQPGRRALHLPIQSDYRYLPSRQYDMPPLLILALFLPWQDRPPEKCSLSGTVVNSVTGEPLNKVELRLEPLGGEAAHVAITTSDAEGRFAMVDLDPGSYRLKGKRNGYLEMSYGAHRPDNDGSVVRLEAGQSLSDLKFKLTPSAVIAGTVRDSDGEPLEGAHITLARSSYEFGPPRVEGSDSADTDDRGEYRFRGLRAGKYYIGVEPKSHGYDQVDHSANAGPMESAVPTLYPGVTDVALAAPVVLSAGAHVGGIDVTLLRSRVFRVGGRVVNAPTAGRLTVVLHDGKNAGMRDYDLRTPTKSGGEFEFRGVPPGSYELTVAGQSLQGSALVSVGASDVDGIRVTLTPGAEIKLRIIAVGSGEPDLSGLDYFLTVNGRIGFGSNPFETDRFIVRNVPPGHYALKFYGSLLRKLHVKSARAGETDVLADGLTVKGDGRIEIEIALASDCAALEGVIRDGNENPVPGATILLAPDRRSRADLFKSVTSDQNGRYEFAASAPGDYMLFAWEDVEPEAWNDPDFLKEYEKQGEKVVLEANARTGVNLHLATRPDQR